MADSSELSSRPILPYGRQTIDDDDLSAVMDVLKSDYLTTGPQVSAFEHKFAHRVQAPHAIACANGTAALHAVMIGMDLSPGDCVIVPSITFLATANAARFTGADVCFADVDPTTALMTPETLERSIDSALRKGWTPRLALIVHMTGRPADMPALKAVADKHDIRLVEDACHALGGTQINPDKTQTPVGACKYSVASCFSFHPVKNIACGEGGMITTSDAAFAKRMRQVINHGMVREAEDMLAPDFSLDEFGQRLPWAYEMQSLGYNYRLSDIHAALGASQLTKLDTFLEARNRIAVRYDAELADLSPIIRTPAPSIHGASGHHVYTIHMDFGEKVPPREEVMKQLHALRIGSQVHYMPVNQQPYYTNIYGSPEGMEGARKWYSSCLSLPFYPTLSDDDIDYVIQALRSIAT